MTVNPADEEAIFHAARAFTSPEARAEYLAQACGENDALRVRVETLLKMYEDQQGRAGLRNPILSLGAFLPLQEGPGTIIGRYKLLEQIGEGGFGVVFMAEQQQPVQRLVALKIIKLGMDTRQVITRFEVERQALAMMDHPGIAKVLDGGATETGRPYFVMELVKGIPITEYCDINNLSIPKRIELFIQVCQAVQHAHQKGLIHRDIKPSNVLVATADDRPIARVIDFGIAKATQARLTEKTLFTEFRQMVGTPEYMSPEQAAGGLDIDTRSDVYSLGVLLYELLAGSPPFDPKDLRSKAFAEMQRIIREVEPPTPSTRLSTMKETLPSVAAHRAIEPRKLNTLLRGELDWIVMRCLEKDRTRRYETASALAQDLEHHLSDQPVQARPATRLHRMRKFIRRNKLAVVATAAVVAALLIGSTMATIGLVQARRQAKLARAQAATATRVTEYLQQMLGAGDPELVTGANYRVRELLDSFAGKFEAGLGDQPDVVASLHSTVGNAYSRLGEHEKARHHLGRALELRRALYGPEHDRYADSVVDLALCFKRNDVHLVESESDIRRAIGIYRKRGVGGGRLIHALWGLQNVLDVAHRYEQMEAVVNETVAEAAKTPDSHPWERYAIFHGLINAKVAQGDLVEAERIARQTLAANIRFFGAESTTTAWSYGILSSVLLSRQNFSEAMSAAKSAAEIMEKRVPRGHEWLGWQLDRIHVTLIVASRSKGLATIVSSADGLGEFERLFRQRLDDAPAEVADFWFVPRTVAARALTRFPELYLSLADELTAAGKPEEAERCRQKIGDAFTFLQNLQAEVANDSLGRAQVCYFAMRFFIRRGADQQARRFRDMLLALDPDAVARTNLPWDLATDADPASRDIPLALQLAKRAVAVHPIAGSFTCLGVAYYRAGSWNEAITALNRALALGQGSAIEDSFFLAMAHWRLGNRGEARRCFDKAVQLMDEQHLSGEELRRFRAEAAGLLNIPDPALSAPGATTRATVSTAATRP